MLEFTDRCPICDGAWDQRAELLGTPASDFSSCAFRCHRCGLAFSNAHSPAARVPITAAAQLNVPEPARPGLVQALAGAINRHNRPTKAIKFCSGRSEDAVTWTVVAGLREAGTTGALAGEPGLGAPQALLMWGHPVEGVRGAQLLETLLAVSDQLGEKPNGRSEPDVMVLWPDLLLLVEAKYGSANDSKPGYEGYGNYLPSPDLFAVDKQQVEQQGTYQLTRNWVIGCRMADRLGVELRLLNLGPAGIADAAAGFAALLSQTSARRFEYRSWQQVLAQGTPPTWLVLYADDHGLVT